MVTFSNPSALDPSLQAQTVEERLVDPRLAGLYFGTEQSPGFINQLQEAARRRLASTSPLQQTAGLSDLQLLGIDRLKEGIGAYEPFLKESEQILRGTVKDFDPTLTSKFFNPFQQAVIDQTIADAAKGFDLQEADIRGRDIQNVGESAFGSRANLTAQERQEAFARGLASTVAGLRQSGFDTAQQRALSEFERKLASERGLADDLVGLSSTIKNLRDSEISNLLDTGALPRNIQETIFSRQFAQETADRNDPLNVLTGIAQILPQYQPGQTAIGSTYGLSPDPTALGLGSAFNAYSSLYGALGPYGSANPYYIPPSQPETTQQNQAQSGIASFVQPKPQNQMFPLGPFPLPGFNNSGPVKPLPITAGMVPFQPISII